MTTIAALRKQYADTILDGMARALWVNAYADWASSLDADEGGTRWDGDVAVEDPEPGGDWDEVAPETPDAAYLAARDLVKLWAEAEGMKIATVLPEMFELAMTVHEAEPFEFHELATGKKDSKAQREEKERKHTIAHEFGADIAMEAIGTGVSWADDFRTRSVSGVFEPKLPTFECRYDGQDLEWNGSAGTVRVGARQRAGYMGMGEPTQQERLGGLTVINSEFAGDTDHTYVFAIGHYGHKFLVYEGDEGDALDRIAAWVLNNAPGLFNDEHVNNEYEAAKAAGKSINEAAELAESDQILVQAGDLEPHWFAADEVRLLATDPDRDTLYELAGFPAFKENKSRRNPLEDEGAEMVMQVTQAIDAPYGPLTSYDPEVFTFESKEGQRETALQPSSGWPEHSVFVRLHPAKASKSLRNWTIAEFGHPLEGKFLENHVHELLSQLVAHLNRVWPLEGSVWTTKAWGWGYLALTDRDDKTPAESTTFVIGRSVDATRDIYARQPVELQNPAGLTAKGERMYEAIRRGYTEVGAARAKEIAARTVLSRAKTGTRGLVQTPSSQRARQRPRKKARR